MYRKTTQQPASFRFLAWMHTVTTLLHYDCWYSMCPVEQWWRSYIWTVPVRQISSPSCHLRRGKQLGAVQSRYVAALCTHLRGIECPCDR